MPDLTCDGCWRPAARACGTVVAIPRCAEAHEVVNRDRAGLGGIARCDKECCHTISFDAYQRKEAHVTNGTAAAETKLVWPSLAGFYATWSEIAYALMRVIVGYILFMHGWVKLGAGVVAVTGSMAKNGFEPASAFAYAALFLETVGAACLIIGLFTRFFAAALAIEIGLAFLVVHLPKGFAAAQ